MAKPLKDCFSAAFIQTLATNINQAYPPFETERFIAQVFDDRWDSLELKQRMRRISQLLGEYLPTDYSQAIDILKPVSDDFSGLAHMLFPDFVELYGLSDIETSLNALEYFTPNSSAEFAIRPFIIRFPRKTMARMKKWSKSDNKHLRRLASEGCRPRLPWAMALPEFKRDPTQVLEIILEMIADKSLYVRRSVANNLNDISKDNPDLIVDISRQHIGRSAHVDWVCKHACRGLLKQGDKRVLPLFGFDCPEHVQLVGFKVSSRVKLGESLPFQFTLQTDRNQLGKLRLEFIIDFMKANGETAPKIFKISEGDFQGRKRSVTKSFSFKLISTRRYYFGEHQLSIVVNGEKLATQAFELIE